jgi:transketolase
MRNEFINQLMSIAEQDKTTHLIVGDMGFSVVEKFQERFPERYINAGISEQNMIGVASGLAIAGNNVYVYSAAPFVTLRCFEQIRHDLCYQNLPVKLVGFGAGFGYVYLGTSHNTIEDIAVMRSLPGMTIFAPGSIKETKNLIPQVNQVKGPTYLRFSSINHTIEYPENSEVIIGKATAVIPGQAHWIIATGSALEFGYKACMILKRQGINVGLASMHTIKPIDQEFFASRKNEMKSIFTIEEHSIIGGLGEAVAKILCEDFDKKIKFKSFGVQDCYFHEVGSRDYLLNRAGLNPEQISYEILKTLGCKYPTSDLGMQTILAK